MNKLCCLIIMFIICGVCDAQNLVPNGDFEQFSSCPTSLSQLDSALFWFNPTLATPDYFNQCDIFPGFAGIPNNFAGDQIAHSGAGYGGIFLTQSPLGTYYREYIEDSLTSALIAGNCYYFQMYVSLADTAKYTTNSISVYFSDSVISQIQTSYTLPFIPQINNATGFIIDNLNWTLIDGYYTAHGGENYLIIGNFKDDPDTDTILINANGQFYGAYVYIDDVCLTLCGSSCTTGIEEQNANAEIKIYPNPCNEKVTLRSNSSELSEIIIYDIASRILLQQKFTNSTSINTEQLAKGIYIYEVRNKNGVIKKGKVVKE